MTAWHQKLRQAWDYKKSRFQDDADEAMDFFNGPHDFFWSGSYKRRPFGGGEDELPEPSFRMTVNKVAECVQLFGPVLYNRNPIRQVTPRQPPKLPIELFGNIMDPMVQQQIMMVNQVQEQQRVMDESRAILLEKYLNYTPQELDLKSESRAVVDEAIIKGRGVWWTEIYQPRGASFKLAGSFYDTVDNLLIDPDMEVMRDAQWTARRCVHPVWEVERMYGLAPGSIRGNMESYQMQSEVQVDQDGDFNRKRGMTNDLLVYWKVYSKMGMGGRLSGVSSTLRQTLEAFGDYCFLAVSEHIPYPLNLPPDVIETADDQEVFRRVQWPTPYWADGDWPFTPLDFHPVPRCVWPMSHIKPGMGELKFLNWAYSFVASKIKTASRDFIAIMKSAGEEIRQRIAHGADYSFIELESTLGSNINQMVQFLQHPPFHGDIWRVVEAVMESFDKRVGLTELMYGQSATQLRSASEAQVKADQLRVRPDDMANCVEDAMSKLSTKEAIAARWHLVSKDVEPAMGKVGAMLWEKVVMSATPDEVVHQYEYRIESGSARKPNRERDVANMQTAMQTLAPILVPYAQATGDVASLNNLMGDWAKVMDLDPERYLLHPPAPMPMTPPGEEPPGEEKPPGKAPAEKPPEAAPPPQMGPPMGPMQ